MRLLLVEDKPDDIALLKTEIAKTRPAVELCAATSRDMALNAIRAEDFDLIVCDLKIPTESGSLDAEVEHGRSVVDAARAAQSGTPILIVSAFADLDYVQDLMSQANQEDAFGARVPVPMLSFIQKTRLPECIARIGEYSAHVQQLDDIAMVEPGNPRLTAPEKRILRIYARRLGGARVTAEHLGGGLSASTVVRFNVVNSRSDMMANAIAKIAAIPDIVDEHQRCVACVTPILKIGDYAPIVDLILAGAGAHGGLIYSVAQGDRSLFEVLKQAPERASEVAAQLEHLEQPWLENAPTDNIEIRVLRGAQLSDDHLALVAERLKLIDWHSFENRQVMVRTARQHGDLHPGNVVVRDDYSPTLVDFGRVGIYSAATDPVSLELSLLFHPGALQILRGWPSLEDAEAWHDLDRFTHSCPVPDFVHACRTWALRVSTSPREVHAVAYAYALRQLKFEDTNHELAVRIALSAAAAFGQ